MERIDRRMLYWLSLSSLVVICCVLAVLQYRWIGEITRAEQERLRGSLQTSLQRLSSDFNSELESACAALQPSNSEVDQSGREQAFASRFEQWRSSTRHVDLFRAIGIAVPAGDDLTLLLLNFESGKYAPAEWPARWSDMRRQLLVRLHGGMPPFLQEDSTVFEIPRFGPPTPGPGQRRGEQDWLVFDLNVDYLRSTLFPTLLATHLGTADCDAEVYGRANPSNIIFQSRLDGRRILQNADATAPLFAIRFGEIARRSSRRGGRRDMPAGGPGAESGRWQLAVQSRAGSLAVLVDRTRIRNVALSGTILALLIATVGLLVHFSRKAHQLAELQMNFVAGVSHELRTPLTVIRTAAFNLRGRLASNPSQVEKYGALIQDEAEKLTVLVEQVLQFSRARAGQVIRERNPIAVKDLIEQLVAARRPLLDASRLTIEIDIPAGLPIILADEIALRNAVQNLIDNAIKHGTEGVKWVGVSASKSVENGMVTVDIAVADRGPGIPAEEQTQIFEAFFRGRRAIDDQIHGTGLGLNLVKKIAEAHGGSLTVVSGPMQGTKFVMRIPAAPPELQNEFAHSIS